MPVPSAPRRKIEKHREASRERLLRVALELFAERGFHGTSIPEVLARAGVGASSLYRLFPSKEELVNAVYQEAKGKLARALADGLDADRRPREVFDGFWSRLSAFAQSEPTAFRFLELQDHVPYLDGVSRSVELSVLTPILLGCIDFQRRGVFRTDIAPGAMIAFIWGAFVGLVKAERLGYLQLDDAAFEAARDACWRAFASASGKRAKA